MAENFGQVLICILNEPGEWWQSSVQYWPIVEAVLVGPGVADGFTGNRGGVSGLACSRRLPHTYVHSNTDEPYPLMLAYRKKINFRLKYKQSEVLVATVWLLCFGVTWWNFERVTGRLTPACWVDVRVIWVHPFIIDVTPAVIMDLKEKRRRSYNTSKILCVHTHSKCTHLNSWFGSKHLNWLHLL